MCIFIKKFFIKKQQLYKLYGWLLSCFLIFFLFVFDNVIAADQLKSSDTNDKTPINMSEIQNFGETLIEMQRESIYNYSEEILPKDNQLLNSYTNSSMEFGSLGEVSSETDTLGFETTGAIGLDSNYSDFGYSSSSTRALENTIAKIMVYNNKITDSYKTNININNTQENISNGTSIGSSTGDEVVSCVVDEAEILGECSLTHSFELSAIDFSAGKFNISQCNEGQNCFDVWMGNIEYSEIKNAEITSYEDQISFVVDNMDFLQDVVIESYSPQGFYSLNLVVDDYADESIIEDTNSIANTSNMNRVISINKSIIADINILRDKQKTSTSIFFKQRVMGPKHGAGYTKLKIYYNPQYLLKSERYQGLNCLNKLSERQSKYPKGNTVIRGICIAGAKASKGCIENGFYTVCSNHFQKPSVIASLEATNNENLSYHPQANVENYNLWDPFCGNMKYELMATNGNNPINLNSSNSLKSCTEALKPYKICEELSSKTNRNDRNENDNANQIIGKLSANQRLKTYKCNREFIDLLPANNKYFNSWNGSDLGSSNISSTSGSCITKTIKETKIKKVESTTSKVCLLTCKNGRYCTSSCSDKEVNGCVITGSTVVDQEYSDNANVNMVRTYDCTSVTEKPTAITRTVVECSDSIRCLGSECFYTEEEEQSDISEVIGNLQLIDIMQDDITCNEASTLKSNVSCHIFKGERTSCSEGFGGEKQCCTNPKAASYGDYLSLLVYGISLKTALNSLESPNHDFGAWKNHNILRNGGLISSELDSITAGLGEKGAMETAKEYSSSLASKLATYVENTFGKELKDKLFTETINIAGEKTVSLKPQITNVAGNIMAAYTAYKLGETMIDMATSCNKEDITTAIKLSTNSCVYSDSVCSKTILGKCIEMKHYYCCYTSPLAKSIMQSLSRGNSLENGFCRGLDIAQLDKYNWESVNLSDWISSVMDNSIIKITDENIDELTGNGSVLSTGKRLNSSERTVERLHKMSK